MNNQLTNIARVDAIDNGDGPLIGNPKRPFLTAQDAYDAIRAIGGTEKYIIDLGVGDWTIALSTTDSLDDNWPNRIGIRGQGIDKTTLTITSEGRAVDNSNLVGISIDLIDVDYQSAELTVTAGAGSNSTTELYGATGGTVKLKNCYIANASAGAGGAGTDLAGAGGSVILTNCYIATQVTAGGDTYSSECGVLSAINCIGGTFTSYGSISAIDCSGTFSSLELSTTNNLKTIDAVRCKGTMTISGNNTAYHAPVNVFDSSLNVTRTENVVGEYVPSSTINIVNSKSNVARVTDGDPQANPTVLFINSIGSVTFVWGNLQPLNSIITNLINPLIPSTFYNLYGAANTVVNCPAAIDFLTDIARDGTECELGTRISSTGASSSNYINLPVA